MASPNGTIVTASAPSITDAVGNVWTLVTSKSRGLQIQRNAVTDTVTGNVVKLVYENGGLYQKNLAGGWWVWTSNTHWVSTSSPIPTPPPPTPTPTPPPTPTPTPTPDEFSAAFSNSFGG